MRRIATQILSYATVRDVIDERYQEMTEARMELRKHQISENKRQREMDEKGREKRRQERMQKKGGGEGDKEEKAAAEAQAEAGAAGNEAHLTERQRLAIQVSHKPHLPPNLLQLLKQLQGDPSGLLKTSS